MYYFFKVIPWDLNFICRRFRKFCSIFVGRVDKDYEMEKTGCSEMWAHKTQTPGNHPKERI